MGIFERVTCNFAAIQREDAILKQRLHRWRTTQYRLPNVRAGTFYSTHVNPMKNGP